MVDHAKLQVCGAVRSCSQPNVWTFWLTSSVSQDGPQCWWPPELVASIIAKEAETRKVDMVICYATYVTSDCANLTVTPVTAGHTSSAAQKNA